MTTLSKKHLTEDLAKLEKELKAANRKLKKVETANRANEPGSDGKQKPKGKTDKADDKTSHVSTVTNGISSGIKTTWEFVCEIASKGWNLICGFFNSIMSGIKGAGYMTANGAHKVKDGMNRENASGYLTATSKNALILAGSLMGLGILYVALMTFGVIATIVTVLIVAVVGGLLGFGLKSKEERDAFFEESEATYKTRKEKADAKRAAQKAEKEAAKASKKSAKKNKKAA